jgi:tetratricopeptide (TPR) repeat protein
MKIEGSLSEDSLVTVMRSLAEGAKTGVLNVTNGTNVGGFYFEDGNMCSVETDQMGEGLGHRLMKSSWITEEQLKEALSIGQSRGGKTPPSEILTEMDVVPYPVLRSHVVEQLEDVISTMLTWREGSYVFDPLPWPSQEKPNVAIETNQILVRAVRRLENLEDLERTLPPRTAVLERTQAQAKDTDLDISEKDILPLVNGVLTISELVELRGGDSLVTLRALSALRAAGLVEAAGKEVRIETAKEPKRSEHVDMGVAFLEMKMYEEARREFRRAVEIHPDSLEARFYLSLTCHKLGLHQEAVQHLAKATELQPVKSAVFNNLGLAHEKLGNLDEAKTFFTMAAEAQGAGSTPWLNLGILCYRLGQFEDAEKALRSALEMGTKSSLCPYYLGLILAERGEYDEAEASFRQSVEANPDSPAAINNLGAVLELKGDSKLAEQEYRSALSIDHDYGKARENLKAFGS